MFASHPELTFTAMHDLEFFTLDSLLVQTLARQFIVVNFWDISARTSRRAMRGSDPD